jgi:hypothetical protein
MESATKNVSNDNGALEFRKCGYPYCKNMALATTDYCKMHEHSSLLVKHPRKKNSPSDKVKKVVSAPKIKAPKKTKTVRAQAPGPSPKSALVVTIVLTGNEALTAAVALALADMINADRFKDADKISGKILRAIVKQIPQHDIDMGAS